MQQKAESLADVQGLGAPEPSEKPVVVVGNGPVGMRVAQELLERLPDTPVVIYGDEPHEPYNRVRLSSLLAGELDRETLAQPLKRSAGARIEERLGYRIETIRKDAKCVVDNTGRVQPYSKLVLATGSSAFVPGIPGIELDGVFTFRNLEDANRLLARRVRSHHTVVLGGGLLGLEAARGMQWGNTRVTVIQLADRLLSQQLDETGSARLRAEVEALGIEVLIGEGVAEVLGEERIRGVRLRSGRELACDTLVLATGIRPNIELAREAGLAFGRGIKVDDAMRTSAPDVYAVGECAEHRGKVYGLVGPGLEQAAVAAANIAATEGHYAGSVAVSRLKVVGTQVFSMGPMGADEDPRYGTAHVYRDDAQGIYRKILVHEHRLVGAIGIGDWAETVRLQTMIEGGRRIWPWQVMRFRRIGRIGPEDEGQGVADWPAQAVVCQCTGATRGAVGKAIMFGACSVADVSKATGASTVCGSCKPLVEELLGSQAAPEPVAMHRTLLGAALVSLLGALVVVFAPKLPYADSVQHPWHWDILWREGLFKQISGFTVLGLFVLGLLLSPRKRIKKLSALGSFGAWRLAHIVLGLLVIMGLAAHTGFRLGDGLNFLLMAGFSATLVLGALSTGVIALEHRIDGALSRRRLRRQSVLWHILLFWPVPVLLGWHVFKSYWY
ncbi:FAD-dependent oxidoreductase [Thiocapsa sp.]|uniref:FAD-dependent oxidoreductase n=1 Tax=Thiocapsa sp. TaxID=2024551 RepID=UPI0035932925